MSVPTIGGPSDQKPVKGGVLGRLKGLFGGREVSREPKGEETASKLARSRLGGSGPTTSGPHMISSYLIPEMPMPTPDLIFTLKTYFGDWNRAHPFQFAKGCAIWKNRFEGITIFVSGKGEVSFSNDGTKIFHGTTEHQVSSNEGKALWKEIAPHISKAVSEHMRGERMRS